MDKEKQQLITLLLSLALVLSSFFVIHWARDKVQQEREREQLWEFQHQEYSICEYDKPLDNFAFDTCFESCTQDHKPFLSTNDAMYALSERCANECQVKFGCKKRYFTNYSEYFDYLRNK